MENPLNAIVSVDSQFGFSKQNCIPWNIKKDKSHFAKLTKNNVIIMGRLTYESIGFPLTNRINIVVSSTKIEDILTCSSIEEAVEEGLKLYFNKTIQKIFIIGGENLYNYALNSMLMENFYVSKVQNNYECDKFLNRDQLYSNFYCNQEEIHDDISFYCFTNKRKYKGEKLYLDLMLQCLLNGEFRETRNSKTWSLFSNCITFNLEEGFPLTTTRKSFFKNVFYELKMFLLGSSDTNEHLVKNGVKIWQQNTSREFLDSVGLNNLDEGNLGYLYGAVWRNFSFKVDQLQNVLNLLRTDPNSRRILMTSYDPANVHLGPLYPCHSLILQFYVLNGKLDIHMYQRSADLFLGLNTNIPSTALLCHVICLMLGNLTPGKITISLGDYHIYESHLNSVIKQLSRTPYDYCTLNVKKFTTIEEMEIEDFELLNYNYHPPIKTDMIA